MRKTPYLAVLVMGVAVAFGLFFSHGGHPRQEPALQCLIPRTFNAGQSVWTPGRAPGFDPAWSVTPVQGWVKWTCGSDSYWKEGHAAKVPVPASGRRPVLLGKPARSG